MHVCPYEHAAKVQSVEVGQPIPITLYTVKNGPDNWVTSQRDSNQPSKPTMAQNDRNTMKNLFVKERTDERVIPSRKTDVLMVMF